MYETGTSGSEQVKVLWCGVKGFFLGGGGGVQNFLVCVISDVAHKLSFFSLQEQIFGRTSKELICNTKTSKSTSNL